MADIDTDLEDNEEETPEVSAVPAAPSLKKAIRQPVTLPDEGAPSYDWIQKQKELADKYAASATPESHSDLKEALARADDAYKTKTDRNDWLEIAQNLGNAITRFGAAQAGLRSKDRYGRDMSHLDLGPGIDYSKRNDRAMGEYLQEQKNAEAIDNLARKRDAATSQSEKDQYTRDMAPFKEGASLAGKAESEGRITKRDIDLANIRDRERKENDNAKEGLRNKGMQSRNLGEQLKQERQKYQKEEETANKVIGELPTLLQSEDSGKDASKLKAKYGDKLPGEDWAGLQKRLSEATKPGTFFGTNPDEEKRKQIIDDEVAAIREKLKTHQSLIDRLQDKRDSLLSGEEPAEAASPASPSSGQQTAPSPPSPSGDEMVTVQMPGESPVRIPASKLEEAKKRGAILKQMATNSLSDLGAVPIEASPAPAAAPIQKNSLSDLGAIPVTRNSLEDLGAVPAHSDYIPKYTRLQEADLDALAKQHGVDKEDIRSLAPWYGVPVELQPGETGISQTAKGAIGSLAQNIGMDVPGWVYKKTQDPKIRAAIDNLNEIARRGKEAEVPGALPLEPEFKKGMEVAQQQAPMALAATSGIGPAGAIAREIPGAISNLARAGKAVVGVGKAAGVGAGIGAASAVSQSREGEEIPALIEGGKTGALLGGGLGIAGETIGFGANYLRNKKLNNTEARIAGEVSKSQEMNIEAAKTKLATEMAPSEKALEAAVVGNRPLTENEARSVVQQHLGVDELEKALDADTVEGHTVRARIADEPDAYAGMSSREAVTKRLADDVVETRYKDLAEKITKQRPDDLAEAQAAVRAYSKSEGGQEQVANRYKNLLDEKQRDQIIQEMGLKTYNQPGAIGKSVNFFSSSGPIFRYFGDKFGLPLEKVHTTLNQAMNRMSFFTAKLESLASTVVDKARKLGAAADLSSDEGGNIYNAMRAGDTARLTPQEQQAAKDVQSFFNIGLQESNGLSREKDVRITPMSIQKLEGYLPVMKLPSTQALPKIQNLLEKTTADLRIKSLGDLTPAQFEQLRVSNPAVDQLAQVAKFFGRTEEAQSPRAVADTLNELLGTRGGANTYETRAAAAMRRTGGEIPDIIREKNIVRMMNAWTQNTARHMYLRQGVEQLQSMANTIEKAGGHYEAKYIRDNVQDLLGVRQGTVGEAARFVKTELTRKMDFLIDRVGSNSVAAAPLKMVKGLPVAMDWLSSQLYNNAFFMNAKNSVQHALAAYTSTAPYLGGAYGYEVVTRALPAAIRDMRKNLELAASRGYMPNAMSRNIENAFTESFQGSVARAGQKATAQINRVGLLPLHLAVDANRALAITVGNKMAEDLVARHPGAMNALRNFSPQMRQELIANINNPEVTSRIISDHLNSAALMHYNKLSMSAAGRVLGPALTAFTRLPTQLWGEALYNLRTDGAVAGGWRAMERLMVPYALLHGAQKLVNKAQGTDEISDREKLVVGQGLEHLTPVAHLAHILSGGAIQPPVIQMGKSLLAPLGSTSEDEMKSKAARAADEAFRTYGPQSGLDRFLLQTIPTVITGHAPEGRTNIEKMQKGVQFYEKKLK